MVTVSTPKSELREVKICVASSIHEFKREREEIVHYFEQLNPVYEKDGIFFNPVIWQTMSHELSDEGSQSRYDNEIRSCQFFFTIIGKRAGDVTVHEFDVAYNQWKNSDEPKYPNIYVLFIRLPENVEEDESVARFKGRFRSSGHYYDEIENNEIERAELIKFRLVTDVTSSHLFRRLLDTKADYVDERARQNLDQMRAQMRENIDKIERMKSQGINRDSIPLILDLYVKNWMRVKEFYIEPDTAYDYASFLADQASFSQAIEIGQWLEKFYSLEQAEAQIIATVKDFLGRCYFRNNQYQQGEAAYREALSVRHKLAEDDPSDVRTNDVSATCNNLGLLLYTTGRFDEAYSMLREALSAVKSTPLAAHIYNNMGNLMKELHRPEDAETAYMFARVLWHELLAGDTNYLAEFAMTSINLGNVVKDSGRKEAAEELYEDALSIFQELAEDNPDAYLNQLAWTYSMMGTLLKEASRMEEAEDMLNKALSIRQKLAEDNEGAFSIGVALVLENLASLYAMTDRIKEALQFYSDAFDIFDKYPERELDKLRIFSNMQILEFNEYMRKMNG